MVGRAEGSLQHAEDLSQAENYFQAARQVAIQQGAKMLELRAASSLCSLWQKQGKGKDGAQILAGLVSQFTEGLDGTEINRARELLIELNNE